MEQVDKLWWVMCGIICIHNNDKRLWFAILMLVVFQNFVNLYIWYVLCVGSFSLALFQAMLREGD
jgi:energy-coupling factor transporter transmembrane protein EcfT